MGFFTRDFQELFGTPYSIVQLMAATGKLPMEGPPAKGRGSRRHYGLEAAFRVGVTARLRGLQMSLEKCDRIVDPLVSLFDTFTRPGAYGPGLEIYHPFRRLDLGRYTYHLEVFSFYMPTEVSSAAPPSPTAGDDENTPPPGPEEHTWITMRIGTAEGLPHNIAPYFLVSDKGPPQQPEAAHLNNADVYLRINLTAITKLLTAFVNTHPKQFRHDSLMTTHT